MMIGPEPMIRIFLMSVRFGMSYVLFYSHSIVLGGFELMS